MIQLIGPGGAGKTTAGAALAARLGVAFTDLDAEFAARNGDISAYLDAVGYDGYAARNVGLYATLLRERAQPGVLALSSGFMTYRDDVHPVYVHYRRQIIASDATFVLLPSLDLETCVAEIVRRQSLRRFSRPPEREEQVSRARFPIYASLPARTVETMRSIEDVVDELWILVTERSVALVGTE